MGGGLMQLVAYGAQDVYLTGNPQITYFKTVYRRHTNFAVETVELTYNGSADFGKKVTATITRNGDLVTNMYMLLKLNEVSFNDDGQHGLFAFVRELGHFIVDNVMFEIGGSQIDKHYGHWLSIWHDLTKDVNTEPAYRSLIGDVPELTALRGPDSEKRLTHGAELYVPMQFWCNANTGLALPLIALQYHEVKLWIEFARFEDLVLLSADRSLSDLTSASKQIEAASLLVDYVYIDTEERRRFAQVGHEYLISQLQFTGEEGIASQNLRVKLGFNHPTKELVWAVKSKSYNTRGTRFLGYTHKDDWSDALQYAAENLTWGSLVVAGDGYTFQGDTSNGATALSLLTGVTGWNQPYSFSTVAGESDVNCVVTFVAGLGITVEDSVSDAVAGTGVTATEMYFIQNAFTNANDSSYNLGNYVHSFDVVFTKDSDGVFSWDVKVTSHSLTVRDLSVPVDAQSWTDARADRSRDVVGSLPRNTGLLVDNTYNPVKTGLLQLNGHDRFDKRNGDYFNLIQTLNAHKSTPANGVNVYSFALHPEQHQPSGTCNLSRIDNTTLNLELWSKEDDLPYWDPSRNPPALAHATSGSQCYIYDVNYNVLRIMSGMGGTAYSN